MISPSPLPAAPSPQLMAELMLSITGLWPSASHPSPNDELAAMGLLDSYRARLKRWLRSADDDDYQPREFDAPEPPDEKALQKKILAPIEGEEQARMMSALQDVESSMLYLAQVKAGRAYLDDHWPKLPEPGISAGVFPLSDEELADVWALTRVLDNPDVLWEELEAQSLTIPMVDAWRAIYPSVATEVDAMLSTLLIERKAADKPLTWQQSDLVRMLLGVPLDTVIEVKTGNTKSPKAAAPQKVEARP